jgi:hypothetical protein
MPLLTPAEAAAELGITVDNLNKWRWKGIGPAFVKLPKATRYDLQEIRKYIASRTCQPSVQSHMEERSATY